MKCLAFSGCASIIPGERDCLAGGSGVRGQEIGIVALHPPSPLPDQQAAAAPPPPLSGASKGRLRSRGPRSHLSVGLFKGQEVCQRDRPFFPSVVSRAAIITSSSACLWHGGSKGSPIPASATCDERLRMRKPLFSADARGGLSRDGCPVRCNVVTCAEIPGGTTWAQYTGNCFICKSVSWLLGAGL